MKGRWLIDLSGNVLRGSIGLRAALDFFYARFAPKPIDLQISGIRFNNVDHILWSLIADIFISQVYTPRGFEIHSDDVVVDIGAHKGVFTAYAAQLTQKTILAYEPDKNNFNYLQSLIKENNWKHVEAVNSALADQAINEIKLYTAESSSRNSIFAKDVVTGEELLESQTVPATTLENAIKPLTQVSLLKMDCEGAEFPILLSADLTTMSKINKMVIEYHAPETSPDFQALIEKLKLIYKYVMVTKTNDSALGYIYAK